MNIVVISGFFNPIHSGHLDYIKAASELGNRLVVIVNNDIQVELKGSIPFMCEKERMRVVSAIKGVDRAILSIDKGKSVIETLKVIYNEHSLDYFFESMTFANGGDRNKGNSPEEKYCKRKDIRTVYNTGGEKTQSSSELLKGSIYA
jgi:cytidyltransferase-like protein